MDKSDIISLEKVTYKTDSLEQKVPDGKTTRDIFCNVKSITRAEWANAAQRGLKPSYCVTIWADEYDGEVVAVYNGVRYSIYRTYQVSTEEIELYLERKAGL